VTRLTDPAKENLVPIPITAETVLAEHDDDDFYCGDESPSLGPLDLTYLCVRPETHTKGGGDHAAVVDGVLLATWPQKSVVAAPEHPPLVAARPSLEDRLAVAERGIDRLRLNLGLAAGIFFAAAATIAVALTPERDAS